MKELFRKARAAIGRTGARVAALATVMSVAATFGAQAAASTTVGGSAQMILQQIANVGKVSIAGAFLCGIYMLAGGLMKLRSAADSQGQQTPYSAGMWRLALGAGLIGLPSLASMMTNSMGLDTVQMAAPGIF